MTKSEIIFQLNQGTKFGNHNTGFIFTKDGEMLMCDYTNDCKYTKYTDIKKFAHRILTFTKTGY